MFVVVPVDERRRPLPRSVQVGESLGRKLGPVLRDHTRARSKTPVHNGFSLVRSHAAKCGIRQQIEQALM